MDPARRALGPLWWTLDSGRGPEEGVPAWDDVHRGIRMSSGMKTLIVKQADALPVPLVHDGDGGEVVDAAAVREVDLQKKKFHWSPFDLADRLSISRPTGDCPP
jgi:hypothetical protein